MTASEQIAHTAAQWRARHDAGLTAVEERDFFAWVESDPRHAACFDEMDATWTILDRTKEIPLAELNQAAIFPARNTMRPLVIATFAAAAALILGFLLWPAHPANSFEATYASESGYPKRLDLPDGSIIRLNASSSIEVHFTPSERRIHLLRGEGLFDVAHNKERPFYVQAAGVSVRAVGTAFNVRLASDAVEVLVIEGRVRVDDSTKGGTLLPATASSSAEPLLEAGQRIVVQLQPSSPPVPVAAIETIALPQQAQALAWHDKILEFNDTPLLTIVQEFNRYNERPIRIADPGLATQRFSGSFRADDPATLVQLLATRASISVEEQPGAVILWQAK